MKDTYYSDTQINSHICPTCNAWVLEAPWDWDMDEIEELLAAHFEDCYWFTNYGVTPRPPLL